MWKVIYPTLEGMWQYLRKFSPVSLQTAVVQVISKSGENKKRGRDWMGFNSCFGVDRQYALSSAIVHKNVPGKSGATALRQIMTGYLRCTPRVKGKTLKTLVCN